MTSLWTTYTNATETRTYNSLLQLTRETVPGLKDMQYGYSAGTNNGRVMSTTDNISGETVQYAYDQLQRLIQAQTSSGETQWGDSYSYDGFGNLTGKNVTLGSAPAAPFQYDPGTNQPINQFYGNPNNPPQNNYDANGNAPVGTWDAENHLVQQVLDGATLSWVYDPSGKRVAQFQQMSGYGQWTFYVYGATGQLVGQIGCSLYSNPAYSTCAAQRANVYFGGKLIARMEPQSGTLVARGVVADRLGTVRAVQTSGGWSTPTYYPWGEAKTAGGIDGQEQFGTYVRDSTLSSQDYAMQRYYSNNTGRFSSADKGTPDPKIPESWNRYAYVGGDPVNFRDPSGRDCIPVSEDAESRSGRTDAYGPCSVGSYGTGGNDYQCGLVSAFADPTPDPFCYVQPQDVTEGPPPSWIPLEEDRGSGAPFDVLGMLPTAREWLGKFNTKSSSPCGKDLSAIGLSVQTVQSLAKDLGVVFAPATINPQIYAQLQQDGADFGVIVNTKLIYYDQNFFWQNSIQTLMATLIHEFSHVNGFDDLTDEGALGVTSDQAITLKIANDCFGIRQ